MRIVGVGGTGLIGTKVVSILSRHGHEAVAAAPQTGVDTVTGAGLSEVLAGAQVVVDVAGAPSFADGPVRDFFTTSTGNLLTAEEHAGVAHHVVLSVVGTDRLPTSGYFRAKAMQEQLVRESALAYSIVRATQFHEFVGRIATSMSDGDAVRVSPGLAQPIAADDVAAAVAHAAIRKPSNTIREIAGPDQYPLDELVRMQFAATGDSRTVVPDPAARYFGAVLDQQSLLPGPEATVFATGFADWLTENAPAALR